MYGLRGCSCFIEVHILHTLSYSKVLHTYKHIPLLSLSLSLSLLLPPSSSSRFLLYTHTCTTIQLGSPFREPVLKFAIKFPAQTVDYFLCRLVESTLSRIFHWFLKHKDGGPLREALLNAPQKIISTTFILAVSFKAYCSVVLSHEVCIHAVYMYMHFMCE